MMRTLRKCKWKYIQVGEVFALNWCWLIFAKLSKKEVILLESDTKGGYLVGNVVNKGKLTIEGDTVGNVI